MSAHPPVRFDTAWRAARDQAESAARQFGKDVVLTRDLLGRVSLLINDCDDELAAGDERVVAAKEALTAAVGPYTGLEPLLLGHLLFAPELYFEADERVELSPRQPSFGVGSVHLLERTAVGTDWTRSTAPATHQPSPEQLDRRDRRVALYGFKGGVGRSTATAVLARHLAGLGRCVLVVDLDLESPGVSDLVEDTAGFPRHGVVDHLIEAGVGNDAGLDLVTRSSALGVEGNGEVWLAPAQGTPLADEQYDYLAKLNRIYSDLAALKPGDSPRPFSARLDQAVSACEDRVTELSRPPDVVLLDSRAGMHDIAAVTLTHLSGLALLFAVDNPSTWEGYRTLFTQWQQRPDRARELRERLRIVAAMFHSAGDAQRLPALRDRAQQLFADTLYDHVGTDDGFEDGFEDGTDDGRVGPDGSDGFDGGVNDPGQAGAQSGKGFGNGSETDFGFNGQEPYHPPLEDAEAPHSPIPILFGNDLVGLDPVRSRDWPEMPFVEAAYRTFTTTVERLLPPPHPESS